MMMYKEFPSVQRLRALASSQMRKAPHWRLASQLYGAPHLDKHNMVAISRQRVQALLRYFGIVSSRSLSLTRWTPIAKREEWSSFFYGASCLGPKSRGTVGKNVLSVDGRSEVLMQRRGISSSCFPQAVLTEGFATTPEA